MSNYNWIRKRGLLDIGSEEEISSPLSKIYHVHSLGSAKTRLPSIPLAMTFLDRWPVREEPGQKSWQNSSYTCIAPATFVLRNVVVHSSAGILGIDGNVVTETLAHTDPDVHCYMDSENSISIRLKTMRRLSGTHITILAAGTANYFHAFMESLSRLSMIPKHILESAKSVIYPSQAVGIGDFLSLLEIPASTNLIPVKDTDTFLVEKLVFPWTVHGLFSYHPCVTAFCDRISANVPNSSGMLPRRIYIDRRGSTNRYLINEDDILQRLRKFGFEALRLETISIADQVRLFRNAEIIVAPHGAGLTNIGFCKPECIVLELHMDAYVNWCFRHLAALRGVRYDCVLGKAMGHWADITSAEVHGMSWQVSADHVEAAVHQMLLG